MKDLMKKISLLGLSFMLVTPFAVSSALPAMLDFYQKQGISAGWVEILFSLSSFAILGVLLLNPILERYLTERQALITGLLLISVGGVLPALSQSYPLVFCSRLILGVGCGLINAHAINIISHYYEGRERTHLLGLRGSTEVLGSAMLTFLAGQLLVLGWETSYLIYLAGLICLGLYLAFIPAPQKTKISSEKTVARVALTGRQIFYLIGLAFYAGFVILLNTGNTLRIPVFVDQLKLGTPGETSMILSIMMLMGIISGALFGPISRALKKWLMPAVVLILGLGMLLLWQGTSLWLIAIGAIVTGFVYSLGVTLVFHKVAEHFKTEQLGQATSLVLIGCNIGGGGAAIVLQLISQLTPDASASFLILGILSLVLGIILVPQAFRK